MYFLFVLKRGEKTPDQFIKSALVKLGVFQLLILLIKSGMFDPKYSLENNYVDCKK